MKRLNILSNYKDRPPHITRIDEQGEALVFLLDLLAYLGIRNAKDSVLTELAETNTVEGYVMPYIKRMRSKLNVKVQ